jgi:hypothetical protein
MPVIEKAIEAVAPGVGKRPIPRLLSRNDLCRFPGRGQPGQRDPEMVLFSMTRFLQSSSRRAAAEISRRLERAGLMNSIPGSVQEATAAGSASGRLALSIVRRDGQLRDPSQAVSQPFRSRRRRKLDYTLFRMPSVYPRSCARNGQKASKGTVIRSSNNLDDSGSLSKPCELASPFRTRSSDLAEVQQSHFRSVQTNIF